MKKFLAICLMALAAFPVLAQESDPYLNYVQLKGDSLHELRHYNAMDNWFFGIHGGANLSLSENTRFGKFGDMIGPSVGLSVGKFFSPAIGFRLQAAYMRQTGRGNQELIDAFPSVMGKGNYHFQTINGYVDALFNFNNIFAKYKESTRFNVIGLFGIGTNRTFGFDDKVDKWKPYGYDVNTKGKFFPSLRAGLMFSQQLSQLLDLTLEGTFAGTDDGFNGMHYDKKWAFYTNVMLGLVFHFKDQYGDRRFKYVDLTNADEARALNDRINQLRAQRPVLRQPDPQITTNYVNHEVLNMTVSFIIDRSNITDIQKKNVKAAAEYIMAHPDLNLVVCGYADVQTAYPAYNLRLSKRRAEAVYKLLTKEYGVPEDRVRIDYKGDTVQPYELKNEWNRVVIFVAEPRN